MKPVILHQMSQLICLSMYSNENEETDPGGGPDYQRKKINTGTNDRDHCRENVREFL